jgi:hypothetical protein
MAVDIDRWIIIGSAEVDSIDARQELMTGANENNGEAYGVVFGMIVYNSIQWKSRMSDIIRRDCIYSSANCYSLRGCILDLDYFKMCATGLGGKI